MGHEVSGNITGLKPSEIKSLEKLYRRRVPPSEAVSYELATTLAELSFEIHRQVGVMVDRRGAIEHVVVGDACAALPAAFAACAWSTPTCAASRSRTTTSPTSPSCAST
jgi:hypothetical protein